MGGARSDRNPSGQDGPLLLGVWHNRRGLLDRRAQLDHCRGPCRRGGLGEARTAKARDPWLSGAAIVASVIHFSSWRRKSKSSFAWPTCGRLVVSSGRQDFI